MENIERINGIPSYGVPMLSNIHKGKDGKNIIFGFGIYPSKSENSSVINVEIEKKYTYVSDKFTPKDNDIIYIVVPSKIYVYTLLKSSDSNIFKTGNKLYEFKTEEPNVKIKLTYNISYDCPTSTIILAESIKDYEIRKSILFFELYADNGKHCILDPDSNHEFYTYEINEFISRGESTDVHIFFAYKESTGTIRKIYDGKKEVKGV